MEKPNQNISMTKRIFLLTCILGLALISGCASEELGKTKIGIVTPLTGDAAFLGQNVLQSAQLTLEKYNLTDKIELIAEDVPCSGNGPNAVKAVTKLISIDKVQAIIGGTCSDETLAIAPIVNEAKVVFVTPLTGGQNIDESGEYVFRNGPSDILAGTLPAAEMLERFGVLKAGLVVDQAAYTVDIAKHFKKKYKGEIVVSEEVPVGENDLRTLAAKIIEKKADGVLILTQDGLSGAYLIKQLREAGYAGAIFGNFLLNTPRLEEIAGNASEGVYVYDPDYDSSGPDVRDFFLSYETRFGQKPSIPFHTTGTRDAIMMISQGFESVGADGPKLHDWLLSNVKGWLGFNGKVSFDSQGNTQTGFVLKEMKDGKLGDI